ncbi:TatD related Dnase [Elsinoe australis]|uniref:TatD related Dnase n=1 Tax=Elsinoe australis TaxID=40998 RepID=A0A4U7ASD9_9PEZI|nr:TatD related Dnase [Elsinoe australis]
MSTRGQDQDLVYNAAAEDMGLKKQDISRVNDAESGCKFLPSFGWHPWFSYQLFDDVHFEGATSLSVEQKIEHFRSVLTPPPEDKDFIKTLPEPRPLSKFLNETRSRLQTYPFALVGEIGLDKQFRLPIAWDESKLELRDASLTPGGREGRKLSPHRVSMDHQRLVLTKQLNLAGELGRPVSVHGVQAPGIVYETLAATWKGHERKTISKRQAKKDRSAAAKVGDAGDEEDEARNGDPEEGYEPKPFPPRICMHSYSGPPDTIKQYTAPEVPAEVFFSFSQAINFEGPQAGKAEEALKKVPDDRVLVESDLHTAGERMAAYLEQGVRRICKIKGWDLEEGVKILGRNWKRFVFGEENVETKES